MDTSVLVSQAQTLTRLLDETDVRPRAVMWVRSEDTDTWRLWIVPSPKVRDKRDFYRRVAQTITENRDALPSLDVGAIQFVQDTHPAMRGMGGFLHMPGTGSAMFTGNLFNGYYLPEGVVVRMDLTEAA